MPQESKRRKTSRSRRASTGKSAQLLEIRSLLPHPEFDVDLTRLAQDVARYYAPKCGLSLNGVTNLSLAMPCHVLLTRKESHPTATVVGGLATYYIARAVSLDSVVSCEVMDKTSDGNQASSSERLRVLTVAPQYCRDDSDGRAMLKRTWDLYTAEERSEIYGVSTFSQFAKRFGIKGRNLPASPRAGTAWVYEQHELLFPEI